jgi:F-type H+-transporting ATPase subunit b
MVIASLFSSHEQLSGGVTIDLDASVLVMVALFLLLWIVLGPLLFRPMIALFEERERRTEGSVAGAKDLLARAEDLKKQYDSLVKTARTEGARERDRIRSEAQKTEQAMLAKAREEAADIVAKEKAKIAEQAVGLRQELAATTANVARDMVARVLGREA